MKAEYRNYDAYRALEKIILAAGIEIVYQEVPDDSIDGEIWARSDSDSLSIMMPDADDFPNAIKATKVLGHELAHILTGLDSPDDPEKREVNEKNCDILGDSFYALAELIANKEAEDALRYASKNAD